MSTVNSASAYGRTAVQKASLIAGIVFIVVGIAGFIPGLTHSTEHLMAAGAASEALLLGLFQVSVLHNIVHLLFGVAGLAAASRPVAARMFLIWGGIVYFVLWIFGLFAVNNDALNFIPVNDADNWLHLVLAIGMVLAGVFLYRTSHEAADDRPRV